MSAKVTASARRREWTHASYWATTKRPLQILAFLAPLVIAYELGLLSVLRSGQDVITNLAHKAILQFFVTFGISEAGVLFLGGAVIVVVLLVWHLLNRDPWKIDPRALGGMAIESAALCVPLLVLAQLIARSEGGTMAAALSQSSSGVPPLESLGMGARLAISIGAGLYEELLFRMLIIAVVHTILVDVGKASHAWGAAIGVAVSAALFTIYHPLDDAAGHFSGQKLAFYLLAGLYFGAVYLLRGFGIVVAVHALYDIVTALFLLPETPT